MRFLSFERNFNSALCETPCNLYVICIKLFRSKFGHGLPSGFYEEARLGFGTTPHGVPIWLGGGSPPAAPAGDGLLQRSNERLGPTLALDQPGEAGISRRIFISYIPPAAKKTGRSPM